MPACGNWEDQSGSSQWLLNDKCNTYSALLRSLTKFAYIEDLRYRAAGMNKNQTGKRE